MVFGSQALSRQTVLIILVYFILNVKLAKISNSVRPMLWYYIVTLSKLRRMATGNVAYYHRLCDTILSSFLVAGGNYRNEFVRLSVRVNSVNTIL